MVNKFLFPKGGAETYMLELGRQLKADGHEVEFFGMDCAGRCVSNSADEYVGEIDFHGASLMKKLSSPVKTIYSKEAAKKLGRVIEVFKPDVIHFNNINFQLTPSVIIEAKKRNIPTVQTVHDVQIACPNHRMYIEQREQVCTECIEKGYLSCIKNRCVQSSLLKSAVAAAESAYYHRKNTYNLIDRYICPSNFMAQQIIKGGVEKDRISVIHNYSPEVNASDYNKSSGERYVLYFGRVSIEKGLKLLFDVMEELPDVKLIVAGTGPLEDELKARGLKNAEFAGFKSGAELYSLISGAAASVYPSQWFENCPMSVIESIKLGTPVITCDIGGTKELIDDGKNGVIYKADDKLSLKEAIEKIYRDSELSEAMSRYCLENGTTAPIKEYAQKIEKIYGELTV
ncbi:MAG: glycosyltransferase family 4 protein [Eubacterium sp.]|nr:glycosyltransferase family 4 protein [Eubacterium sp.]